MVSMRQAFTKCGRRWRAQWQLTISREAEVKGEVKVEVKEVEEVKEVKVVEITITVVGVRTIKTIIVVKEIIATLEETDITDIKPKDMLTNLHLKPVSGTGLTGSLHISAWSQGPAPGRSSGPPSPTTNDGPASPVKMTSLSKYTIICIRQIFQKYMPY